jgi:predicted transcriptional regulator
MPLRGLKSVPIDSPIEEIRQIGIKSKQNLIPVLHPKDKRLIGYFEVTNLKNVSSHPKLRPLQTFNENTGQIAVLNKMVSEKCSLCRIVNNENQIVGVVLRDRLVFQMLQRT